MFCLPLNSLLKTEEHVNNNLCIRLVTSSSLYDFSLFDKKKSVNFVGEKLASTMQGEQEDIDQAVGAAREAFKSWSKLPGHVRARYLYSIARHVQKHARLLAVLESMDNGKPIRETRDADVQIVARHLYHHAGWAQLMDSEMRGKQFMTRVNLLF